jgi:predicted O-linked N-acetylglucosamine transferase (SPINDLY family)
VRLKVGAQDAVHAQTEPQQTPTAPSTGQSGTESSPAKRSATKHTTLKGRAPSQQDINALVTLFTSGRLQEAAPVAQAMTERFPQHEFGWKALGAILKQLGRNSDALPAMQKAALLSPDDLEAHYNLGVTLQELGKLNEAESSYRSALEINRNYAPAHANLGVTLQKLERFAEAEACYRQAIKINPQHAKALGNLGVVLQRLGRPDEAEISLAKALALNPDSAETHVNLGNLLNEQNQDEEAERHFRLAINLDPNYADAHYNLANLLQRLGRLDDAEVQLQHTLRIKPDFADAHYNLGNLLTKLERLQDAESAFRRAITLRPNFTEATFNLGNLLAVLSRGEEAEQCFRQAIADDPKYTAAYCKLGVLLITHSRYAEAEQILRQAVEISPNDADAHCQLGNALYLQQRLGEAGVCYWSAIKIAPDSADAYCNLGAVLIEWNRFDEAEEALFHALESDPEKPTTHFNLGNLYLRKGQLIESETRLRRALELKPDYADAQSTLANTLLDMGRLAEAQVCYREVLATNPTNASVHSNLLFCLLHDETVEAMHLLTEHRRFGEQFNVVPQGDVARHSNSRDPERCLEVGFVSGDFRNHAVAFFIEPILEHLKHHRQLSLHAYSNAKVEDSVTERLRGLFKHWHPVNSLSDEALEAKIRTDGIDILIDLSGHSGHNRLLTFAHKPAPLQASWIGYPGTTGLSAMDYYLADRYLLPEGVFDEQFTEKIVRLPANAPFLPFEGAPPVTELPALKNGHVTFASFNRLSKITRATIALWGELLRRVPDSKMVLAAMPLNERHEKLIEWFAQEDIAIERLQFHERCDMPEYLALHQQVDLCLDTFPYNGGTTTQHALWMGVPTLTLPGNGMPGRVGAAILSRIGLQAFVAENAQDFVERGCHWVANLGELAELRTSLRAHLSQSPLRKPSVIAAGLARALRIMWQRWCANLPAESFEVTLQDIDATPQKGRE